MGGNTGLMLASVEEIQHWVVTDNIVTCPAELFRHLKLKLLTQFLASNDEKYRYFSKIYIF